MEAANLIRSGIGRVQGAQKLQVGGLGLWGMPVSIALRSDNLEQLRGAKDMLETELKKMSALKDVSDNDPPGIREVRVTLNSKARALGLTESEVMQDVRSGFFGYEAQRVLRGIDEVKIWVRYSSRDRSQIENPRRCASGSRTGDLYRSEK